MVSKNYPRIQRRHVLCCAHIFTDLQHKTHRHSFANTVAMTPQPLHSSVAALLAHTCSAYTANSPTVPVAASAKEPANCGAVGQVGTNAVTAGRCCTNKNIEALQLTFASKTGTPDGIHRMDVQDDIYSASFAHEQQIGLQHKSHGCSSPNTVAIIPRPLHSTLAALSAHTWYAYSKRVVVAAGAKEPANCGAGGQVGTGAVTAGRCCAKKDRATSAHFRIEKRHA